MKPIKMLGLMALAALAAMAFVGASSASAVTLCKENVNPCPEGKRYTTGTVIKAHSAKAVLKGFTTVTCESDVEDTLSETSGTPLKDLITSVTFSNCSGCTGATALNLPWLTLLHATSGGNGTMLVENDGNGTPGARLTGCPFGIECVFSVSENGGVAHLTVNGGSPATIRTGEGESTAVKLERTGGSSFCGSTATWEATYTATSPEGGKAFVEASP
jgi:hypothetical protein